MPIVFYTATTVNGFLADTHDSVEWLFEVPGQHPDASAFIEGVSVCVTGSTTYEWMIEHEDLLAQPDKWQTYFADMPMYVFTTQELRAPAGADVRFVQGAVSDHIDQIRDAAGTGTIWVQGGGELAGQFLDAGLLDELTLNVAPAFLAEGRPLLPRTVQPDRLRLQSATQVGQFAVLTYTVVDAGADNG